MKIISSKKKLLKIIKNEKNLGFVPTMGAIHLGHISLIKKSNQQCNKTIVSIFINKPQFNNNSDFSKYPRRINKDIYLLKKAKIDYLYLPKFDQIYPSGPNNKIAISSFSKDLCGKNRPGHFKAVVDVIERFIKLINPKRIYFGLKDMQQLKIIEHYINKNKIKTKVVGCKTIREKNGLALSSRNQLLSEKEKKTGSLIYKFLLLNKKKLIKGKINLKDVKNNIYKLGANKIDYLKIINVNKIIKPYKKNNNYKIFIAYNLGSTRLIDNI